MKKMELIKRGVILGIASVLVGMSFVGCGQSDTGNFEAAKTAENAYYNYDMAETEEAYCAEYPVEATGAMENGTTINTDGELLNQNAGKQKLIQTVNLEVETVDFNLLMSNMETKIDELGGYVENAYTYNGSVYGYRSEMKYATITARVPVTKLDQFITDVSGFSNVISKNTSTQNVTLQYVDTESRKKMLLAEQDSYLALLEKAESVEDIVYLTGQLTEVRSNIESMESQLRTYDNLVDYATITISVQEVAVLTPTTVVEEEKTVGQEIKEGFMKNLHEIGESFTEFGINFVIALPNIILFLLWCAVIFFVIRLIIFIIKRIVRKQKAKKALKQQGVALNSTKMESAKQVENSKIESEPSKTEENK